MVLTQQCFSRALLVCGPWNVFLASLFLLSPTHHNRGEDDGLWRKKRAIDQKTQQGERKSPAATQQAPYSQKVDSHREMPLWFASIPNPELCLLCGSRLSESRAEITLDVHYFIKYPSTSWEMKRLLLLNNKKNSFLFYLFHFCAWLGRRSRWTTNWMQQSHHTCKNCYKREGTFKATTLQNTGTMPSWFVIFGYFFSPSWGENAALTPFTTGKCWHKDASWAL